MDTLSARAVATALFVGRSFGLHCDDEPELLKDGSNVLVHLKPAPVVARVATTTGLVRQPARLWLERDLAVASFLAERGFPIIPPSAELPPGPHMQDGLAISFWEYVSHERGYAAPASETAAMLRELHAALRGYPGELPRLGAIAEIPHWIDQIVAWDAITAGDAAMLRAAHATLLSQIDRLGLPEQPLHGDAHNRNLLKTKDGLLWTDFEDACRGPLAWDVACFASVALEGKEAALAGYGGEVSPEMLTPFLEAREMEGVVWSVILATRFPERRARAEEMLMRARLRYSRGWIE